MPRSKQPKPSFDMPTTNDDIYVNSGEGFESGIFYPEDDKERKIQEAEDKGVLGASYPILPKLDEWFEEQIKNCKNIHNIQTEEMEVNNVKFSRTASIEGQVLAYQLLEQLLNEKAAEFRGFKEGME